MAKYDYLIIGAGLFGATIAQQLTKKGFKVLVIDQRPHLGGNCYTEPKQGINIHKYGAHIFHTSNDQVWQYVNQFARFNHYVNRPKVHYQNKIYSFPINLMTLYQLWNVTTPEQAQKKLDTVKIPNSNPQNLEEWILSQVGREIYEIFIKGYTTKQWDRDPKELPSFIIKRLPIRLTFDDNYFNDCYQGIPMGGYTSMIQKMLKGIEVKLNTDFFSDRKNLTSQAKHMVFTGKIDKYFNYCHQELEYRSLRFETEKLSIPDFQGNAVINYTDAAVPYTRIIEHKHFEFITTDHTYVTHEYPDTWTTKKIPYYPVNNETNNQIYQKYQTLAQKEKNVFFGGRLAEYKYYDMDDTIEAAFNLLKRLP
jgi:UDP-galactopyranose mutase